MQSQQVTDDNEPPTYQEATASKKVSPCGLTYSLIANTICLFDSEHQMKTNTTDII